MNDLTSLKNEEYIYKTYSWFFKLVLVIPAVPVVPRFILCLEDQMFWLLGKFSSLYQNLKENRRDLGFVEKVKMRICNLSLIDVYL